MLAASYQDPSLQLIRAALSNQCEPESIRPAKHSVLGPELWPLQPAVLQITLGQDLGRDVVERNQLLPVVRPQQAPTQRPNGQPIPHHDVDEGGLDEAAPPIRADLLLDGVEAHGRRAARLEPLEARLEQRRAPAPPAHRLVHAEEPDPPRAVREHERHHAPLRVVRVLLRRDYQPSVFACRGIVRCAVRGRSVLCLG